MQIAYTNFYIINDVFLRFNYTPKVALIKVFFCLHVKNGLYNSYPAVIGLRIMGRDHSLFPQQKIDLSALPIGEEEGGNFLMHFYAAAEVLRHESEKERK